LERLGDVYDRLAGRDPEEWRRRFHESDEYARHVAARLPASAPEPTGPTSPNAGPRARAREVLRQGWVLTRRRLALLRGGWPALATLAVQTAIVAAALLLVFGDLRAEADPVARARSSVTLYFLLAVSAFWFGCNGAVKVVVADRPIYLRERAVNLSLLGYAGSTFAVYCAVALVQTAVLASAVWFGCRPPGMGSGVVGVLAVTAAAGTALGMALSAAARSEEMAVAAVPLVLIPQIVFGGVVAALSGLALWVAKGVVTTYWAHRAISGLLPEDVAALSGAGPGGASQAVGVVVGHAIVFAAAALAVLWCLDARHSYSGRAR
jgi:hypothetical protein